MTPIELAGVFGIIKDIIHTYGERTKQDNILYADFYNFNENGIYTVYKDQDWPDEPKEFGYVPILAFTDMDAAVKIYEDQQAEKKKLQDARNLYGEYGRYLMLKEQFEGKEPPPSPYRQRS